jgi:hypothetical protein
MAPIMTAEFINESLACLRAYHPNLEYITYEISHAGDVLLVMVSDHTTGRDMIANFYVGGYYFDILPVALDAATLMQLYPEFYRIG